jgi:hypothetical protein
MKQRLGLCWGLWGDLVRGLQPNPELDRAKSYVDTNKVSGASQFEILKREGLKPSSKLLEIGCGCLNAGEYFIEYLDRDNYVGVDPNEWLREAAMKLRNIRRLIGDKKPTFLSNDKFDASSLGHEFRLHFLSFNSFSCRPLAT